MRDQRAFLNGRIIGLFLFHGDNTLTAMAQHKRTWHPKWLIGCEYDACASSFLTNITVKGIVQHYVKCITLPPCPNQQPWDN